MTRLLPGMHRAFLAVNRYAAVRVRVYGLGSGPFDPGGLGWVLPTFLSGVWVVGRASRLFRRGSRRRDGEPDPGQTQDRFLRESRSIRGGSCGS